jgi:hypothetical protein
MDVIKNLSSDLALGLALGLELGSVSPRNISETDRIFPNGVGLENNPE